MGNFGNKLAKSYKENKKFFLGVLKSFRKPTPNTLKNIRDERGNILFTEDETFERWKRYFESLLEKEDECNDVREKRETQEVGCNPGQLNDIQKSELDEAVHKLKLRKAPGCDNILPEIIEFLNESGRRELLDLMNKAKNEKKVPKD